MKVSPVSYNTVINKTVKNVSNPLKLTGLAAVATAGTSAAKNKLESENFNTKEMFAQDSKHSIPLSDIADKLIDIGYKPNQYGILINKFNFHKNMDLVKSYGKNAFSFHHILAEPVKKEHLEEIQNFIEIGGKTGEKLYKENFGNLYKTYAVLKNSHCYNDFMAVCCDNKDTYKLIENIISKPMDKKTLKSFLTYKGKAYFGTAKDMQDALRRKSDNEKYQIEGWIQKHINNMSSYIETQKIPETVKLYRGESCHTSLNSVSLKNGEKINLGHMMYLAAKSEDQDEINKVRELILDNEISAKLPAFTSTSLNEGMAIEFSEQRSINDRIVWELDVAPDTKGVFIEVVHPSGKFKEQNEVLLQKNSKIVIQDAIFDEEKNIWIVKGKVSN